jgi:hypothetical protein
MAASALKWSRAHLCTAWTNTLLALDVSTDWATASPALTTLEADGGDPPAVALAGLYSDRAGEHLYLLGGQFSDTPVVTPAANDVWRYDVSARSWSAASTTGQAVRRSAEGSPAVLAGHGANGEPVALWGFGHLDYLTDPSWSIETPRAWLSSLVTLDLGSLALSNASSTSSSASVGTGNSTTQATPASRADGTLTYVPGMGTDGKGILVSIGGAAPGQAMDNGELGTLAMSGCAILAE